VNIAKSPILSKLFDAAAITQTKLGLVNEIAKASGMAPPNPGPTWLRRWGKRSGLRRHRRAQQGAVGSRG
jgi:hypothetical protein